MPNHDVVYYVETGAGNKPIFVMQSSGFVSPRKPYVHPLNYTMLKRFLNQDSHDPYRVGLNCYSGETCNFSSPEASLAYNRAYSGLVNSSGSPSQWANNLLELGEASKMCVTRLTQLYTAARALKRGRLGDAAKAFQSPPGWRGRSKRAGNDFLEWHFGWQPMCQDIYNAVSTMVSDPPWKVVKGNSSFSTDKADYTSGANFHDSRRQTSVGHVRVACRVRVSNPNAFLANQLGFANPAAIAWEAVPLSFVADWFGNVGQCLSSMTDFMGLEVQDGYLTWFGTSDFTQDYYYDPTFGGNPSAVSYQRGNVHTVSMSRVPGSPPAPALTFTPFKGFSPARGATAAALLLQYL